MLTDARPLALSWEVSPDAQEVELSGVGVVPNVGSASLQQRRRTEYVLTARSLFGIATTRRITVDVASTPPVIHSFDAQPKLLASNSSATIEWSVDGAETVVLEPLGVQLSPRGSRQVEVGTSMVFVLKAESYFGAIAERTLPVVVLEHSSEPIRTPPPMASAPITATSPLRSAVAAIRPMRLCQTVAPAPVDLPLRA